jgi:hypothetical protein
MDRSTMQVLKNIKITILYEAQLHSTSNQSAEGGRWNAQQK